MKEKKMRQQTREVLRLSLSIIISRQSKAGKKKLEKESKEDEEEGGRRDNLVAVFDQYSTD